MLNGESQESMSAGPESKTRKAGRQRDTLAEEIWVWHTPKDGKNKRFCRGHKLLRSTGVTGSHGVNYLGNFIQDLPRL